MPASTHAHKAIRRWAMRSSYDMCKWCAFDDKPCASCLRMPTRTAPGLARGGASASLSELESVGTSSASDDMWLHRDNINVSKHCMDACMQAFMPGSSAHLTHRRRSRRTSRVDASAAFAPLSPASSIFYMRMQHGYCIMHTPLVRCQVNARRWAYSGKAREACCGQAFRILKLPSRAGRSSMRRMPASPRGRCFQL